MMLYYIAFGLVILVANSLQDGIPLENMTLIHAWNNLEYGFECPEDYDIAIKNKLYIEDGFKRPYDADMAILNGKVTYFISTPRVVNGMPYTLATVSEEQGKYGPLLLPYPNFKAHLESGSKNCEWIVSVFRIYVDPCNRLWAIDNGRNFADVPSVKCPPKILVFDLKTNKLLFKYVIPSEQYNEQNVYNGIMVHISDPPPKGQCKSGKAYLTDARGFSLLVFDLGRKDSWVIYNDLFKTDPAYINTTINGETFTFPDGLYISTPDPKRDKMYLHSYTSVSEIAAKLSTVNNAGIWKSDPSGNQDEFQVIGTRESQCPVQALDINGNNLYFSQYNPLSIQSWNPDESYEQSNFKIVVQNNQTLAFVAGMKVRLDKQGNELLLVLSNNLQKLNTGSIKLEDINYRLMFSKTSDLQSGEESCGDL